MPYAPWELAGTIMGYFAIAAAFLAIFGPRISDAAPRQVKISVNASQSQGLLKPVNQFFGCDEPNYAYYPNGQQLLGDLGNLSATQTYFRTHNLLTTGECPATIPIETARL